MYICFGGENFILIYKFIYFIINLESHFHFNILNKNIYLSSKFHESIDTGLG